MEVDVEQIMREIRENLKDENWDDLPSFEDLPFSGHAFHPGNASPGTFAYEVDGMNRSWNVEYVWPLSTNPIKRLAQRVIKRSLKFLFVPVIEQQNEFNSYTTRALSLEKNLLEENELLRKQIRKDRDDMGAMARQIMLSKWKLIDHLRAETEKPDDMLTCKICGTSQRRAEYEIRESECIFNGGVLTRYVCPGCGAVFGPTKFVDQGQKGIDEDYWVHYLGFSEGDSSYKEERAFRMLNPDKKKKYLNFGCGKWSGTLQKLREEGYNVYGYEPYAPEENNPYLITSREELGKYRFDGIFSNDVLEHFVDPVEELRFMKGLLADMGSKMAHCTACYTYKYEYTRFHTFFFLGDSVKVMADRAGLEIVSYVDDLEKNDFYCYLFAPKSDDNSEQSEMSTQDQVVAQEK